MQTQSTSGANKPAMYKGGEGNEQRMHGNHQHHDQPAIHCNIHYGDMLTISERIDMSREIRELLRQKNPFNQPKGGEVTETL